MTKATAVAWAAGLALSIGPLLAMSASADELPAAWWDTDKQDCQVWNPQPHPNETVTWSGACRDGKADGQGKLVYSHVDESGKAQREKVDANLDLGKDSEWYDTDRPNCRVRIRGVAIKIEAWSGNCVDGKADGQGKLKWSTPVEGKRVKAIFDGTITSGADEWQGVWSGSNGYRQEGQSVNGLMEGHQVIVDSVGARFEGEYTRGVRTFGILTTADGTRYEGEFKDSKANGHGVRLLPNGDRMEGDFTDGHLNGQGTYLFADGARYEGDFKNGKFSGQGVLMYTNGARYEGRFSDSKANGRGTYVYENGARYQGDFKDEKFSGQGVMNYADGSRYEGNFSDDQADGIGECRGPDGTTGQCEYANGEFVRWLE